MKMKFKCPNGHKLRAPQSYVGQEASCPKCSVRFFVTAPEPSRRISDSSILAVLGDFDAATSVITRVAASPPPQSRRTCPRCGKQPSAGYQVCPYCQLYLPHPTQKIA